MSGGESKRRNLRSTADMMVTKRIRSEYMKNFKDPKWETYNKCYEEMLKYRMTRRLLEYTHNPWFWSGSDSDSDSGGRSPCSAPNKNQVQAEAGGDGDGAGAEAEECEQATMDRWQEQQARTTGAVQRLSILNEAGENVSAVHGSQPEGADETKVLQDEREEEKVNSRGRKQTTSLNRDQVSRGLQPAQSKSTKPSWRSQRVRPATTRQPREESKDSRHPFALYGSGEQDADMAARKTHNVGPAASTKEIHESALRARTRREVERQMQSQRSERRRARSSDLNKTRRVVQPEFNPWLTEYMRCFSARSR